MHQLPSLEQFLERHRISEETWSAADVEWDKLSDIFDDYCGRYDELVDTAALHARILQRCPAVHSVRWRVKDPEHVLEKIVRKRAKGADKYASLDRSSYATVISDLIGLRALHLFKSDWQGIHTLVSERWLTKEMPIAYVRVGDSEQFTDDYRSAGCKVEIHPKGYRSVHYIIATKPQRQEILAEIQVRTIFEEGWSEIDHKVRYPNFSDNALLAVFLGVFNRMAGSADEMGAFVQHLVEEIGRHETHAAASRKQVQDHLAKIEALAKELSQHKEKAGREKTLEQIEAIASQLRRSSEQAEAQLPSPNFTRTVAGLAALAGGIATMAVMGSGASAVPLAAGLVGALVSSAGKRQESLAQGLVDESLAGKHLWSSLGGQLSKEPLVTSALDASTRGPRIPTRQTDSHGRSPKKDVRPQDDINPAPRKKGV